MLQVGLWAIVATAVVVLGIVAAQWTNHQQGETARTQSTLSVLPFTAENSSTANTQLAEGLRIDIINRFAQIPTLALVTDRAAEYQLTGLMRDSEQGNVRATVQLTRTGRVLSSQNFESPLSNPTAAQLRGSNSTTRGHALPLFARQTALSQSRLPLCPTFAPLSQMVTPPWTIPG